jgi:hypothetical protein
MRRTSTRRFLLIGALAALFVVLFFLIACVNELEFLPGKPLPEPTGGEPIAGTTPLLDLSSLTQILPTALSVLLCLTLSAFLIYLILFRQFRWQLLRWILACAMFLVLLHVFNPARHELPSDLEEEAGGRGDASTQVSVQLEIPPIEPPNWGVILLSAGLALGVGGLLTLLVVKLYPILRARRTRNAFFEELSEQAGRAAAQIRAGGNPYDVVLRCYKEMSDLLSRREQIHHAIALTPREFARLLRTQGVEDHHVDRLTAIFEEVRYGRRSGPPFAREAVFCLEAIQKAYAPVGAA